MVKINLYDPTTPAAGRPAKRSKQYFPAATAAANQVGVVLVQTYGQQQWILQAMQACQEAVQNCILMLSGTTPPPANNQPLGQGGQYAFPARTREELQATQQQAAHQGHTNPQAQLDSSQNNALLLDGNIDMFAQLQQQTGMADPASQGVPQSQSLPEAQNGSDDWLL